MSETIIAGLDLDAPEQAREALSLATWLTDTTSSELVAASIFAPRPGALSPQVESCRHQLAAFAARPVETVAIAGTSPARHLHELADRIRPRAVVVGSSQSGADGVVSLGSVGELLLHGGGAPIAVAPKGFRAPERRPAEIGVAFGDTPESDDAVRVAAGLAGGAGARLRVLIVPEPTPHDELIHGRPGEHLERALAGAPADRRELDGEPATALAAASADLDLLIAGSRSYGPLGAVLLGAVTRQLVRSSACPVMVVPRVRDPALAVALVGGMSVPDDA
jgi:nucleotide-binding universal stress UspA family protein